MRTWPQARLLEFSAGDGSPCLILPPQGGHSSTIVDYAPHQSQVRTARDAGLRRLYSLDWRPATDATANTTIEDYIRILDETVAAVGGPVHLVGDCQGGWLAAIYAALRPDSVRSLGLGGAPIDCHAGSSGIQEWLRLLARGNEIGFYRALVAMGGGKHLGRNQITGFKMLEPMAEFERLSQLWRNIGDPAYVERHIDFTNWFEFGQDMPGTFYLWVVEHLFVRNELFRGTLRVDDTVVDLARIAVPLFLIAGRRDHITPPEQMFALADVASSDAVRTWTLDAGHLGLFMGQAALAGPWTEVFRSMAAQDS